MRRPTGDLRGGLYRATCGAEEETKGMHSRQPLPWAGSREWTAQVFAHSR